MFTRSPRAPFPLSEAHCAVLNGLLFPSLSLRCEVVVSIEYYPMSTKSSRQLRQIIHSPQRKFRQCPQANPPAELYSAAKASAIWTLYGENPLENVSNPTLGEIYGDKVTYYVRKGKHFLSRDDWQRFLSVFDKNINLKEQV